MLEGASKVAQSPSLKTSSSSKAEICGLKMRLATQRSSHLSRPVLNNKQECFRHKMTDRSELKSGSGINMPVMVEDEENTKKVTD